MLNREFLVRPVSGGGTNELNPGWGQAGAKLKRLTFNDQGANGALSGTERPGAREISNTVSVQTENTTNKAGASDFLWIWGQFLDHDLSLTEAGSTVSANISVPLGDPQMDPFFTGESEIPFNRVDPHDGAYVNEITAYIDASMIYGSDEETVAEMRVAGGKLVMTEDAQLELEGANLLTGDVRAAENLALSSMHTIFTREHNRIVDELSTADPTMSDDDLFNAGRARVEALVQAVTYNEFLPMLIGDDALDAYGGYDETVDVGISVEFSTAVFRLGHTLLSPDLQMVAENGRIEDPIALRDAFFRPTLLSEDDLIEDLMRGAATQTAQAMDTMIVEDVRSFLFGPPGAGGLDLASLNIQRGRDLGVPSYNDLREGLGLERVETFDDITSDAQIAARLQAAYDDVDLIDAWIGGLAEDALDGALLGETFSIVMIDQFTRLRDGDPLWSAGRDDLSETEQAELWNTTLSDIIVRNTDIENIQTDVFTAMNRMSGSDRFDWISGTGDADFILGLGSTDYLYGRRGDDEMRGGDGHDILVGNRGDDLLMGDSGSDRLLGGVGSDTLTGGAGRDVFIFNAAQKGEDVITDFTLGQDELQIWYLYLVEEITLEQQGNNIKLSFDDVWTLTLENFDAMTPENFDLDPLLSWAYRGIAPDITVISQEDQPEPGPEPELVFETGTIFNDHFDAGGGVDRVINGGLGWDTVTFSGRSSEASSQVIDGNLVVTAGDGSVTTLIDVESMLFDINDANAHPWINMYEGGWFSL